MQQKRRQWGIGLVAGGGAGLIIVFLWNQLIGETKTVWLYLVPVVAALVGVAVITWKVSEGSTADRKTGIVKWFNPTKGFGFIEQDEGEDLFVHRTEIQSRKLRSLNKNDRVEFEISEGKKGPVAKNVRKLDE